MSYQAGRIKSIDGNVIQIENPSVVPISTLLSSAVAATGTTLTVNDNSGFQYGVSGALPDLLLIGQLGVEKTEIKKITNTITAGTSLTIAATVFPHSIDTPVSKYLFDKVEILGSSTTTGNKTSIDVINLQVDAQSTTYVVSGTTYNYYFVRYYNSQATTPYYSDYSAAVPATDFVFLTVKPAIDEAFRMINDKPSEFFSLSDAYAEINNCYHEVIKERKKWSWRYIYDYQLGSLGLGDWFLTLPTDMEDRNSNKSIRAPHLGGERDLIYVDKSEWDRITSNFSYSTLSQPAGYLATGAFTDDSPSANSIAWTSVTISSGGTTYTITDGNTSSAYVYLDTSVSTTEFQTSASLPAVSSTIVYLVKNDSGSALPGIRLTSTADFDETGSISIEEDEISYSSSNDSSNGVLYGASGQSAAHASGVYAFQGVTTGQPLYYTVKNQTLFVYPVVSTSYADRGLYIDYTRGITVVSSDTDSLLIPDHMLVAYYLAWKILLKKNNGAESEGSMSMFAKYQTRLNMLKSLERTGQFTDLQPRPTVWMNYRNQTRFRVDQ
jgi:hypothetical protein